MDSASGVLRDPLDSRACPAPQDLRDPLVTQGSSPKAPLTFSAPPSAHQAPLGPQECRDSRDPLATKGSKERSAKTARRATPAPLGPLASRALWGCRALEGSEDCKGRLGPRGTGVPSGSKGPSGSQEPRGKRVTEVSGAQRGSVAPRVTSADLVPRGSPEWPGPEESRACRAGTAGTACQASRARRATLVAMVPQERRVPTGYRVSQDEQGPRARRENWAELESWARPAPRESPVCLETSVCPASVARLATGAQRGL